VAGQRYSKRDPFGFRAEQIVWTPLRRRAVLRRYREDEGKWDADYIQAIDGKAIEPTLLNPKHIKPVD